ncbi:hypothetical protein GLOTRDRAFT_43607 [Gloeophyllum trabeum ATCC 11539]|uniref:GH16 domain-containing protein n=1 Tax=Gloeophyllum trabeum (strain ATCC 11539 / FP-39264 / Madison 617) TaxID=670483 RepID=S7RPE0_GLOTA|nr:uncharacterized protein GLOTRDRAFT_43607 [Gloeophyllum trabeum ATCC 11539]EPQ54704.1 hypothetical protein GLOTRDRAFT_43607 [Gloeophyllum trabeum ATCC 11539]
MFKVQLSTVTASIGLAAFATLLLSPPASADTITIPTSSFDSTSSLEQYWNYNYPWGDTHNGAARMSSDHVSASGGVLTLTAVPASDSDSDIHYHSGTIYAKEQVNVDGTDAVGYQVEGEFIAPTTKGTWPAFWLNAASGWPPESDIAEWKGERTDQIWFNTFNTSSQVASKVVTWPDDGNYHAVKGVLRTIPGNSADLSIEYYLDGTLQATHTAAGYVGKALNLIIDLQMEGSSGSPGPTGTTTFKIRNVQMTKLTS